MGPSPRITVATLAILNGLLEDPDTPLYGLEIARRAGLKPGTIYPALARLEQANWLESAWEDVDPEVMGRPRRRHYRLTGEGAVAAREAVDEHLRRLNRVASPPIGMRGPRTA